MTEDNESVLAAAEDFSAAAPSREYGGLKRGSRFIDARMAYVSVPAEEAWVPIRRIGGQTGWYFANFLWRLRGLMDRLAGGQGMRPGRADPEWLSAGDLLDVWRVEEIVEGRLLRLRAQMKLPGEAWLQFEVREDEIGTLVRQMAVFDASRIAGRLYWYALYPAHALVFRGMLRGIVREISRPSI